MIRRGSMILPCWAALGLVFGIANIIDAAMSFGWQDAEGAAGALHSFWVAVRNVVGFTLLPIAAAYLFGRRARWTLAAAFGYIVIAEVACGIAGKVYHVSFAGLWLKYITDFNPIDWGYILSSPPPALLAGIALAMALVIAGGGALIVRARYPEANRGTAMCAFAMTLPFIVFNLLLQNWSFGMKQMNYTALPLGTWVAWRDERGVRNALENRGLPERVAAETVRLPDLVIMVGESETRFHWHLYGYHRDTTPRLDALNRAGEVVVIQDMRSPFAETRRALIRAFTDADMDDKGRGNWTLAAYLARAGYRSVLVSNQKEPPYDDLYRVYDGCEKRIYLADRIEAERIFDDELLPFVRSELGEASEKRPVAMFVHFGGMHFPMTVTCPAGEEHFRTAQREETEEDEAASRVDRYDDGVRYMDGVRGRILDLLAARPRPTVAFFVGDHGESPEAMVWRDSAAPSSYAVPAFIYLNPAARSSEQIAWRFRLVSPYSFPRQDLFPDLVLRVLR